MGDHIHLRDVVLSSIGSVLIDTAFVFDNKCYETLVVKCNYKGDPDWSSDLDCKLHSSEEDAIKGHNKMKDKWEV